MKAVYFGGSFCSFETFQRLFLIADEIAFLDRPSVSFGQWGTVGEQSPARQLALPEDCPVRVRAFAPPWGPAERYYKKYLEQDLVTPAFVSTFLKGLRNDRVFSSRFVAPDMNYGAGTGAQIVAALSADSHLDAAPLTGPVDPRRMFAFETHEDRVQAVQHMLHEASISVSAALSAVARDDLLPVSDDPFMCRLLALRATDQHYVGSTPKMAAILGLAVAQAVLPDDVLKHLTLEDLIDYRKEAAAAYASWTVEINRLAVNLGTIDPTRLDDELKSIIVRDVAPRIQEHTHEMRAVRDRMFGGLIKKVLTNSARQVPTLLLVHHISMDWREGLGAFALSIVGPEVIDAVIGKRDGARKHAMAYLVGLSPESSGS